MFDFLFGKEKRNSSKGSSGSSAGPPKPSAGIQQLDEAINLLQTKEKVLEKKIADELAKAKEFYAKNLKTRAVECMKRKNTYEEQRNRLGAQIMNLENQRFTLETQKLNIEVIQAQKKAAEELKKGNKENNIDKIETQMEDLAEEMDKAKNVSEILANPIDSNMMIMDDDDILNELEMEVDREKEEQEALKTSVKPENAKVSAAPLPSNLPSVKVNPQSKEDDMYIAQLEAELEA